MLENVGFTTEMETPVDVLQTERVPTPINFAWEVKRPWSEDSITDLIEKGAKQVEKAVAGEIDTVGHQVDGGCVVLVLDHVLVPGRALIEGIPAEQASKLIADALSEWARARPAILNVGRSSPNVLGVMLWFRTLAQVVGPSGGTWAEAHMRHWWGYRDSTTDDWRYRMLFGFHKQIEARAQLPLGE